MQHGLPRGASATSLAESEMSADGPDSHDDRDDDSEASDEDVAEWDPQPGDAPPLAPGVSKLAEGVLDADVKEVYSRLLADQVKSAAGLSSKPYSKRRMNSILLPRSPTLAWLEQRERLLGLDGPLCCN